MISFVKNKNMTPEQFTYWLKGFIEVENPKRLSKKQTQILKDHLDLVFDKVTPDRNNEKKVLLIEGDIPKTNLRGYKPKRACSIVKC